MTDQEKQAAYYEALAATERKERDRAAVRSSFNDIFREVYNDRHLSMLRVLDVAIHSDGHRPPGWRPMPPLETHGPRLKPYLGQSLRLATYALPEPNDEDD